MITLPIQIGREYVRRDGKIVKAIKSSASHVAGVEHNGTKIASEAVYLANGRYRGDGADHFADLVAVCFPIEDEPHAHAALMALYAQDATETIHPWRRWENRRKDSNGPWSPQSDHPEWNPALEYRRKPKTIRIGAFVVPEPERQPLANGTLYYVPTLSVGDPWARVEWWDDKWDREYLRRGLVHLTREAAEAHGRALLSFTETPS